LARRSSAPRRAPHKCAVLALAFAILAIAAPARGQQPVAEPQAGPTYQQLWERGEYRAALDALNVLLAPESPGFPQPMRSNLTQLHYDRAQLRFATGLVDEAIEDMADIAEHQQQPSYSLELALMYQYRGAPLLYDQWLQRAAGQTRSRDWYYRRRSENVAAVGRIAELMGTNPKTVLSAHFGQANQVFPDLGPVVDIAAGDLAFRNQGFDIAEKYYLTALEKEPRQQDALAGLLECYVRSNDERAEEIIQRLSALNPNHPRLDAILTERRLENLDIGKAQELIEKQLGINPVSHRFRSLKAASLFLKNDLPGMNSVIEAALDYNPVRSEVYRTVGRIASRQYRFKEGAEFQQKALELDPKDFEARALYTLDLMRLGREQEGKTELEAAFAADPFNVQLYNMLQLMSTLETFATVERGDFVLRLPKKEAPVMAEAALDLLDEEIALLEKKYQIALEKPILVEMFDNHDDFMVRSVGLAGNAGYLGICFGKLVTMDTPSVRPKGSSNWRSVLWHEFAHVATLQKTKNRMPRWLSEGISVYEEEQRSEAWHNRLDPQYLPILKAEGIPGLRSIDGFFTRPKSPMHLMYGYFMAGEFIEFYTLRYGFQALVDALAAVGAGSSAEAALVESAKVPFEKLDADFHEHLQKRFKAYDNLPQPAEPKKGLVQQLTRLLLGGAPATTAAGGPPPPSPFTDALRGGEEAAARGDFAAAENAWKRALELFPDYDGENAPLPRLAQMYKDQGRDDEYRAALERLRLSSPQELEASLTLAGEYQRRGDWDGVIRTADWVLGIDPYDPTPYKLLTEAKSKTGRGAEALDPLAVLMHLDDGNAAGYRLQRAHILRDTQQWGPAKTEVVKLLEDMPNFWEAQQLLLDIVEHGVAGAGGSAR
jgi:tetratricopeptide (TPR) repeat protein